MSKARRIQARHRAADCIYLVSSHLETGREWINNPMSIARGNQAKHLVTDCISQVPPEKSRSHGTRGVRFGRLLLDAHREQQNASSSSRRNESHNPNAQATGERLQSKLTSVGDVKNVVYGRQADSEVGNQEENPKETFEH